MLAITVALILYMLHYKKTRINTILLAFTRVFRSQNIATSGFGTTEAAVIAGLLPVVVLGHTHAVQGGISAVESPCVRM